MLNQLPISELTVRLARREVSAREATQACLEQITRSDSQLKAFLSLDAADSLAQADAADQRLLGGLRRRFQSRLLHSGKHEVVDAVAGPGAH